MNIELLRDVRRVIAQHPSRHDQTTYVRVGGKYQMPLAASVRELRPYAYTDVPQMPEDRHRPLCKTTACVAGWAVILGGDPDLTLGDASLRPSFMFIRGAELLGISNPCASWLFCAERSREAVLWGLDWLAGHPGAIMRDLQRALEETLPTQVCCCEDLDEPCSREQ